MWPRGDGPEEDASDSTNTAGLLNGELGLDASLEGHSSSSIHRAMVSDWEENLLALPHDHRMLAPLKPHLVNIVIWGIRECVSLHTRPHKTVVGYLHKHLKQKGYIYHNQQIPSWFCINKDSRRLSQSLRWAKVQGKMNLLFRKCFPTTFETCVSFKILRRWDHSRAFTFPRPLFYCIFISGTNSQTSHQVYPPFKV